MTDRLFADCCYGTPYQHLPSDPCPQRFIHALEGVMNNPIARTALSDDLYKEIIALTSACGREELLSGPALAAGAQSAETTQLAQSEGRQSGGEAVTPEPPPPSPHTPRGT
jgi:hypothetical protein